MYRCTSSKSIRLVCCGIVVDQDLTPNVPPVVKNNYIDIFSTFFYPKT
jgi:hypothetical protein